jgi:hypothetical protein
MRDFNFGILRKLYNHLLRLSVVRRKLSVAILFLTGTLPATAIALILAFVGSPFFVVGVIEFLRGNIDLLSSLSDPQPGITLLWITGPLGLVGLHTLWELSYFYYNDIPINNRRAIVTGLISGMIAGIQMFTIGFGLLVLLLPSVIYYSVRLYKERNHEQS